MVLLSLTMFILELTVGVNGWPAGKVVGAIISLLCLIISAFALCLTYSGRNFNLRTISVNNVPVNIGDFTLDLDLYNYLKNGWIGFNSDEACRKQILQSRFLYFPLIAVLGLLSLTVVIEEFVIIGDWSCKNYSENWVDGVFWGVLCDCQYWAGISAACTIIFISLFFGGAYKPSWPVAMIAGTLTFGYGIFMAMITISSVQSLMIVGNFTDNDNPESNDLILEPVTNRFLHLLPIQYLAVLMITLGVSFIGHCFFKAQEPTDICRKIIKTASLIGVVILTVVNMTVTQIDVTEQLWKYWERRECDEYSYCHPALPWGIKNIYLLYLSSTLSLSLVLLGCACFKILHANRTIPGTINWILSLCMLGLTIFCIVVLFHDPYYVHFHDKKIVERMILKETPLWNLILNFITIWIGGIAGVFGLIYYSIDTLQALAWISAAVVYPFVCLASLCHFAMQYKIAATQKGPTEETEPQTAAADNEEPTATSTTGLGSRQLIPNTRNPPAISERQLLTLLNETE